VGLIKVFGDFLMGRTIGESPIGTDSQSPSALRYFLAPAKDIIIGILWFVPLVSSTVVWRGNRYVIGKDSHLSPCPETGFWSWGYRITDSIRAKMA
jgi:hypothetical protein